MRGEVQTNTDGRAASSGTTWTTERGSRGNHTELRVTLHIAHAVAFLIGAGGLPPGAGDHSAHAIRIVFTNAVLALGRTGDG